jgi:hypothetical protein
MVVRGWQSRAAHIRAARKQREKMPALVGFLLFTFLFLLGTQSMDGVTHIQGGSLPLVNLP